MLAWWLVLGAAIATLHAAGRALPAPPLDAPSRWSEWMAGRDPVVVAFAVVRLVGLGAAWYGVVVTAVGVILRLSSAPRLATLVDHLTVAPLRGLAAATVAAAISASAWGATAATAGPTAPPATVAPSATVAAGPPVTITMHRLEPSAPPAPVSPAPVPRAPATGSATWTVRAGQCFWSIAEAELGRAWGRPPTADEVVPYWHRLIEANRGVLADPHNADLVFPGQVFTLPEQ